MYYPEDGHAGRPSPHETTVDQKRYRRSHACGAPISDVPQLI